MVFITLYWKSTPLDGAIRHGTVRKLSLLTFLLATLLIFLPAASAAGLAHAAPTSAHLSQFRTEIADDGIYLNASVSFELPAVVEDALLKGIALFFVLEVDIYRERWYWTDPRVASAARTVRLAYQPLTRRWRVNIGPGVMGTSAGLRATFNQNYDTLSEALSAVQRVARWKVAEVADIRPSADHRVNFSFKLDLSQLPRPFQIGVVGQREWSIALESEQRLLLHAARPADAVRDSAQEGLK
jgi:hypothetical protein